MICSGAIEAPSAWRKMSFGSIKEHWDKIATVIALTSEAAVAFEHHLAEVSLEARFVIVGIAGMAATLSLAEMIRWNSETPKAAGFNFGPAPRGRISAQRVIAAGFIIVTSSTVSMFLLNETTTFHTIRLLQRTDSSDPSVGTLEVQPAHTPADVALTLSTSQVDDVEIEYKAPASWNDQDPVEWGIKNDSPFGSTITLNDFRSPQVFGCWFRLSKKPADGLKADATAVHHAEIRVLRDEQLRSYRRNIRIFGGVLCVVSLVYWSYRSCWFRRTP